MGHGAPPDATIRLGYPFELRRQVAQRAPVAGRGADRRTDVLAILAPVNAAYPVRHPTIALDAVSSDSALSILPNWNPGTNVPVASSSICVQRQTPTPEAGGNRSECTRAVAFRQ
jgi:hypothetical protein